MRILLVAQTFYPENFKSNDMAFELARRGHDVTVLTGIPNIPLGKYYKGYGFLRKRIEKLKNIKIFRAFQTTQGTKRPNYRIALNYLSFAFCSLLPALYLTLTRKFDCVLIYMVSPATQSLPAIMVKKLQRIPLYTWVLDLWPESVTSGRGITNRRILDNIEKYVKWTYRNSDRILISSRDFADLIAEKGEEFRKKIIYFPNWADDVQSLPDKEVPKFPEGFRIMMAGNMSLTQSMDKVMHATLMMKDRKDVKWIFVGGGGMIDYMKKFVAEHHLEETVIIAGAFPPESMGSIYAQADALFISLQASFPHIEAVIPARMQSYMSSGKPIIGMCNGSVAALIKEADCGVCAPAEDPEGLCRKVEEVLADRKKFARLGENGRQFFLKNFTIKHCFDHLEDIIRS